MNAPGSPIAPGSPGFTQAFAARLADADAPAAAFADGAVIVAAFDLDDWQAFLPQAIALVDAPESARAARQRDPAHRDALLLAYALHRALLAWLLDCPADRVALRRDAKGCPRLPGDGVYTSLSHAGGRVAVAATRSGPVGIDLEPDARAADMHELVAHVAHRDELGPLSRLPVEARGLELLRLWVRKEALLKAAGIGLELEMHTLAAPEGARLPLPGATFPGRVVELRRLDADPGWTMALAAAPGAEVRRAILAG